MRLANLDGRATIVTDDGGIDVATWSDGRFGPDVHALYDDWAAFRAAAADVAGALIGPIDEAALGPPAPRPRQVFGIGLNYVAHAAESGAEIPKVPATFTKFPTCLAGPYGDVRPAE